MAGGEPTADGRNRRLVEAGYDRVAGEYLASKDPHDPAALDALEELSHRLPPGASLLDLGCGAGVPVTRWLSERFAVTGVDVSARQLELARERVPSATFIKADMTELDLAPETFDAVVALHSIIHVPRREQPALLSRIRGWLRPGGYFLATWTLTGWEGEESDWRGWGAPMWWSHHGREDNLEMLREAGFGIHSARTWKSAEEEWLWVLAARPSSEQKE